MNDIKTQKQYYYWIDNIKCFACILVALGHFWMSMIASNLQKENIAYNLIIQSIYTFHVPLFFVCSGFLYQKSNKVHSFKSWGENIFDKALNLGVPYFTFTLITFLMKAVFSSSVNNQNDNIIRTLFISPTAPYWFLYALFFLFLFVPCMNSRKQAYILLIVAFVLKGANIILVTNKIHLPNILNYITGLLIWFSIGIFISFDVDLSKIPIKTIMIILISAAVTTCAFVYQHQISNEAIKFLIGIMFVIGIVIAAGNLNNKKLNDVCHKYSKYFMPVYLMHTIFAAGIRILLMKLGITNLIVHIIFGVSFSFILPMLIYKFCTKIPIFMFFISPKKAIQLKEERRNNEFEF